MALGFTTSSTYGSRQVTPDRGFNRNVELNTKVVSFGDGYEQRISRGRNNKIENYSLQFMNRPKAEADDIAGFFSSLKGVTSFALTVPDHASLEETTGVLDSSTDNEKTIKVVCSGFTQTYVQEENFTIQAQLRRVYEA